jgi:hypothetical protein
MQPGFLDFKLKPCEACHLQNDHTEDLALKRLGLSGPCKKYEAKHGTPNVHCDKSTVMQSEFSVPNVTKRMRVQPGFPDFQLKPCEACHLQNDHTEDLALKRPDLIGPCKKYEANACCNKVVTSNITNRVGLYDAEFNWDQCYSNHKNISDTLNANATLKASFDKCQRWFQLEECFYECDVNAGKFRKHGNCRDETGSNSWQIQGLPVRATECDTFYKDCQDMILCTCIGAECTGGLTGKSLFGMATVKGACANSTQFCKRTVKEVHFSLC